MAQTSAVPRSSTLAPHASGQTKFLIGGLLIIAAIVYLVVSTLQSTAQYFYTVSEVQTKGLSLVGRNLRVSGAVLGDTIQYDSATLTISFLMANITNDTAEIERLGGLAQVLHLAVSDPAIPQMRVVYVGPKPDLLKNEAQAIVTGRLGEDGVFYADELLLKCPTRYDEAVPAQAQESGN
jgi:cytochrome c-type biogenesis protein CcmE